MDGRGGLGEPRGAAPRNAGVPTRVNDGKTTVYAGTYRDVLRFAQRRVHPPHAEDVLSELVALADGYRESTG